MTALVIGVNYRTDAHAFRFARSLARYAADDISVIVVDNSERDDADGFARHIRDANSNVQCVRAPRNLGYFGGADYGLRRHLETAALPNWVVVCNVDIEFQDSEFFQKLRRLGAIHGLGVVAPCIRSVRWQWDLNPKIVTRPSKKRMAFYKVVLGNYYLQNAYELLSMVKSGLKLAARRLPFLSRQKDDGTASDDVVSIYAPHGSCMAFSRRYFDAGGNLEYPAFLFGEEIFVAESAKRLGLLVAHCPELWVLDLEHASTGILRSRKIAKHVKEATNYLVKAYFTRMRER